MTADVELPPSSVAAFVEALKGERGSLDAWLEVNNEREVAAHVEAYAHATAAKDAEIEALRAEVEKIQALRKHHRARHKSYKRRHADAVARAERLAVALRGIEKELGSELVVVSGGRAYLPERTFRKALHDVRAALHPTAAQENDDA